MFVSEQRRYIYKLCMMSVQFTSRADAFFSDIEFDRSMKNSTALNAGLALLRFRDRVVRDPFGALWDWNENYGGFDPCAWFGVECSDGKVMTL